MPETTPLKDKAACGTKPAPPCTLVIFGAGGDLTKRLLMPSLYNLAGAGLLPEGFSIIGVDHGDGDDQSLRDGLTKTMEEFSKDPSSEFHAASIDAKSWGFIRDRLHYLKGDFEKPETFQAVKAKVKGSAVFYCAVAARFFGTIVDGLGQAGLLKQEGDSFRRVVIEKPFGSDLASAQELNARILKQGDESQFYRIDHFLGKDTVQSIMAFRFANGLWSRSGGGNTSTACRSRRPRRWAWRSAAASTTPTGALRDMVPNHMFQLLCMVGMEPPNSFDAEAVRTEKAKLAEAVQPIRPEDAVRGQYTAGTSEGRQVPGYRDEPHVAKDSATETYIALKLHIENWRLGGGAVLHPHRQADDRRRTEIAVLFKPAPFKMFEDTDRRSAPDGDAHHHRPGSRDQHGIQREGAGPGDEDRPGAHGVQVRRLLREHAERGLRDPALRLHDRRRDAVPAGRQHRGGLGGGGPAAQGLAAGEPGPLRRRQRRPEGGDDLLARDGRHWLGIDGTTD